MATLTRCGVFLWSSIMQTKTCSKCNKEKTIDNFAMEKSGKFGVRGDCKSCKKDAYKKWREKNKEYDKQRQARWRSENLEYGKVWEFENKNKRKEQKTLWLNKNPARKIAANLRTRLYHAIIGRKSASTMELVGCSIDKLKQHLESKFTEGMSWDNYGKWHVDHIKPCASFDLSDPQQQRLCFNYKNLQPLWAADNLSKGASED
jgi:hypothetical protein